MKASALAGLALVAFALNATPALATTAGPVDTTADARVEAGSPTSNFGTATTFKVTGGGSPIVTYLKFTLPTFTGTANSATVTLRATNTVAAGAWEVHEALSTGWIESGVGGITYSSAPGYAALPILATSPAQTGGSNVSVNLSASNITLTSGATISLALVGTTGASNPAFQSKEGANHPNISVDYTSVVAPTVAVTPVTGAPSSSPPAVSFTTTGSPTTVSCIVDGGTPVTPCTSPFTPSTSDIAKHTVEVDVSNSAGSDSDSTSYVQVKSNACYVSTAVGAADTGSSTWSTPYATLTYAAAHCNLGSDIYFLAGSYAGGDITRSISTQANGLTFRPLPGDAVTFDGALGRGGVNLLDVVDIKSSTGWITFQGFTVTGGINNPSLGLFGSGVTIENNLTHDITITGDNLTNNEGYGVRVFDADKVTVTANDISHNGSGVRLEDGTAKSSSNTSYGHVVANNVIHDNDRMLVNTVSPTTDDNGGNALQVSNLRSATIPTEIYGNTAYNNYAVSNDYGYDGGFLDVFAKNDVDSSGWINVHDNVSYDSENFFEDGSPSSVFAGGAAKATCPNINIYRNLVYNTANVTPTGSPGNVHFLGMLIRCGTNMVVANNTFVNMGAYAFSTEHNSGNGHGVLDTVTLENNVVDQQGNGFNVYQFNNASDLPTSFTIDYNEGFTNGNYSNRGTGSLADFKTFVGGAANELDTDPLLDSAFQPTFGSPAIDSGTTVAGVPNDGTPDRGSFDS